jgi:hypothetical protein
VDVGEVGWIILEISPRSVCFIMRDNLRLHNHNADNPVRPGYILNIQSAHTAFPLSYLVDDLGLSVSL